ncbi:DsbA family protein [Halorientalis salina]|uniref:DsbA family protein n=1 Tax=Halorientalis salina TaxID=2932266 RepID=UPI0010ABD9DC|nr:thioredoxin domain-containing protein [Halorientalis salina]
MPERDTHVGRRAFLTGSVAALSVTTAGCLGGGDTQETLDVPETTAETGTATGDTAAAETLPRPIRGDPDADVTVMVFEDYACPHCATYSLDVAPEILSTYADPGDIRYEFYDFPIPVDEQVSWEAAIAARAVQATEGQDAFFEYSKALFEAQADLDRDAYERIASDAGLDGAAIRQAAVDRTHEPTVRADREFGQRAGVTGTPTVAVNQRVVDPTVEAISDAIDAELA